MGGVGCEAAGEPRGGRPEHREPEPFDIVTVRRVSPVVDHWVAPCNDPQKPVGGDLETSASTRCDPRGKGGLQGWGGVGVHGLCVCAGGAANGNNGRMYAEEFPDDLLDDIASRLRQASRVVVFTGAGISTDSGIPDFRGPNGLWTKNPLAEKTSTLSHYLGNPEVRKVAWEGRAATFDGRATPNDGHRAITRIQQVGKLAAVVTQNVDGLHQDAGVDPDRVVEVHGTIKFGRCWDCNDRRPMLEFIERVRAGEADPACHVCGGIVKSDVILFEQALVPEVIERAFDEAEKCDLMLAVGSTLQVTPANGVVARARAAGADVVIVNGDETAMDRLAHVVMRGSITHALTAVVARAGF